MCRLESASRAGPEAACGTQRSEYRTGEGVGEAAPLMLMEATEPTGKGGGQGHRPQRLPPQTVGQEPTRVAPKGLAQAKRGAFPLATLGWFSRARKKADSAATLSAWVPSSLQESGSRS